MRLEQISIIDWNFQFNFTPHIRFVLFIAHLFVREQQKDVARSIDFKPTAHLIFIFILYYVPNRRGYSSVEEHPTADRNVPGSTPGSPFHIRRLSI